MMRAWAIADCIVYGCLILSYFGWTIRVKRNYESYRSVVEEAYGKKAKQDLASVVPDVLVTSQGVQAIKHALESHIMNDIEGRLQRTNSFEDNDKES